MYSGVSTDTFLKYITAQELTAEGLLGIAETVADLAELEELEGHRQAILLRIEDIRSNNK